MRISDEYTTHASVMNANMRFICNWLCKTVRKLKIDIGQIRMLLFYQSQEECKARFLESAMVLECNVTLSMEEMLRLRGLTSLEDRYEFYLSFLEKGYIEASKHTPLPIDSLLSLHEQFRLNGYKNEWLFKKKVIREYGLYVYLKCYFTTFDFHLELEAYDLKQTTQIARGVIFRSFPDELCFDKDFRSIRVEGSKLQILNFLQIVEMEVNLDELAHGRVVVKYIDDDFLNWAITNERTKQAIERITW